MLKKIVDAKADAKGNIKAVRFQGNKTFTGIKTAIRLAEKGDISNAHAVNRKGAVKHLRTNPDLLRKNNLDDMARDA